MWPAPCSWRTRMWRIGESMIGSYTGRMRAAGQAEDDLDALHLEGLDQGLTVRSSASGPPGERRGGQVVVGPAENDDDLPDRGGRGCARASRGRGALGEYQDRESAGHGRQHVTAPEPPQPRTRSARSNFACPARSTGLSKTGPGMNRASPANVLETDRLVPRTLGALTSAQRSRPASSPRSSRSAPCPCWWWQRSAVPSGPAAAGAVAAVAQASSRCRRRRPCPRRRRHVEPVLAAVGGTRSPAGTGNGGLLPKTGIGSASRGCWSAAAGALAIGARAFLRTRAVA